MRGLEQKALQYARKTVKRHGKSIAPPYYWKPVKTQDLTQAELAKRIGANKGYIPRIR